MRRAPLRPALALLAALALVGCKTQLNTGLTQDAANEEVALLLHAGIPAARGADAKGGTFSVLVEQNRFADAVDLLHAHGLPHEHFDSIPDMFKGGGLVPSPTEERARLTYAQGEELSRTIAEIDGVLSARVHIVTQEDDPLRRVSPPSSASVFVRYAPGSAVDQLVPQIKMLVADGVPGLAYDRVSVVMVPAAGAQDAPASAEMRNVFGLWVESGSEATVRLIVAFAGGLIAIAASGAAWLGWRHRHRLEFTKTIPLPVRRLLLR